MYSIGVHVRTRGALSAPQNVLSLDNVCKQEVLEYRSKPNHMITGIHTAHSTLHTTHTYTYTQNARTHIDAHAHAHAQTQRSERNTTATRMAMTMTCDPQPTSTANAASNTNATPMRPQYDLNCKFDLNCTRCQ